MKRTIKVVGLVLVTFLILALAGIYILFWNEINILESVNVFETGGETTVYIMDYETDYHLEEVLKIGASSDADIAAVLSTISSHGMYTAERSISAKPGCEVLSAVNADGKLVWGRNFDWCYSVPIIVRSNPKEGYASIATCEFTNITQDPELSPYFTKSKFMAVSALYVPMDGINEKGLCVGDIEVKEGGMNVVDTNKVNLPTVIAVRMLLNKAANIDEAIALLEQFDIFPSGDVAHHIAISDASGRAVVVEFFDGGMQVIEQHVATNFGIYNNGIEQAEAPAVDRYNTLLNAYNRKNGVMSKDEVLHTMEAVVHEDPFWQTRWTMIYEYREDRILVDYYFGSDFTKKNTVELAFK